MTFIEGLWHSSKTREVAVTLRDGARFVYGLAIPNRVGVRGAKRPKLGRIPRISKLIALAIKMERLMREGKVPDQKALATAGHISKPRMSQIMNLTNLAPEIQETLLFLPKTMAGEDSITERQMRPIVQAVDWELQRKLFSEKSRTARPAEEEHSGKKLFGQGVDPLASALDGLNPQAELLSDVPANEATHAVGLPSGGLHNGCRLAPEGC